jgi:hypothetical protein
MINEKIQPASMKKQMVVALLVVCTLFGLYALWEIIFPPTMTPQCAYLIEKYPPENFSSISGSAKEETLKCLYIKQRYNQETWKVNENYISR